MPIGNPADHTGAQSVSVAYAHPPGQQPSPLWHWVIGWALQTALQDCALPLRTSRVHTLPSEQLTGHAPSQISGGSIVMLPQLGEQSVSVIALHPTAQQPSPDTHCVIGWNEHAALHELAEPTRLSIVHAEASLHAVGHEVPSQVSPVETTPSPHVEEQSASVARVQPAGQQPSPPLHAEIAWKLQAALHEDAAPTSASIVHALPSEHVVGQSASHVSPRSSCALPHVVEQSSSVFGVQPSAQQPSPFIHVVIASYSHALSQVARSIVHATPSVHDTEQSPSHLSLMLTTPSPQIACVASSPPQPATTKTTATTFSQRDMFDHHTCSASSNASA